MNKELIGKVLHGFCNGYFGRDSYGPKTIEGVGPDWIVARQEDGVAVFASFPAGTSQHSIEILVSIWQLSGMTEEECELYEEL